MKNIEEPITSSHDVKRAVTQWCLLFKIVYDGLQFEQKLISYNWEGKKVLKTMSSIFKSYNADRNVKSLSDDPHSRRKEREDRKEMHSAAILHQFTWDCIAQMHSSPEITDCKNAIKKKMLLVMQATLSCKLQTLDDIRKANYTMQFVFLMDWFSDAFLGVCEKMVQENFWKSFENSVNQVLHKKNPSLEPYRFPLIVHRKYEILYCNDLVKRRLLSIAAAHCINPNIVQQIGKRFDGIGQIIAQLYDCITEESDLSRAC